MDSLYKMSYYPTYYYECNCMSDKFFINYDVAIKYLEKNFIESGNWSWTNEDKDTIIDKVNKDIIQLIEVEVITNV